MNNKTKGVIAGVAGIALLAGGTTFALWEAGDTADGGVITAGNLDVALTDEPTWEDTSSDRDTRAIDLTTFRMVPGDTIEGTYVLDAALDGDNLLADLALTIAGDPMEVGLLPGLDLTYTVYDADDKVIADSTDAGSGMTSTLELRSEKNEADSTLSSVGSQLDGTTDLKVIVRAKFKDTTSDQELVNTTAALQNLSVTLIQKRPTEASDGE